VDERLAETLAIAQAPACCAGRACWSSRLPSRSWPPIRPSLPRMRHCLVGLGRLQWR